MFGEKIRILLFLFPVLIMGSASDPKNSDLSSQKDSKYLKECQKGTKNACEKSLTYSLHLSAKMHKGVSKSRFLSSLGTSDWIDILKEASRQSYASAELEKQDKNNFDHSADIYLLSNAHQYQSQSQLSFEIGQLLTYVEEFKMLDRTIASLLISSNKTNLSILQYDFSESIAKELKKEGL